jgi:hypothetical protein
LDQWRQWEQNPWNHNSSGSFPLTDSRGSWLWRHGLLGCQERSKGNLFVKSGSPPETESMHNLCFLKELPGQTMAWPHTKFSAIFQYKFQNIRLEQQLISNFFFLNFYLLYMFQCHEELDFTCSFPKVKVPPANNEKEFVIILYLGPTIFNIII